MMEKMIRVIKELVSFFVRISGLPFLIRKTIADKGVAILVYHDPEESVLRKHLHYLSRRYNFISIDTLLQAIDTGNWRSIPPKSLVLSFDDGHLGNFRLKGLFEKYKIRPVIYLCSGIVGTNNHFWWRVEGLDNKKNIDYMKSLSNLKRESVLREEHGFQKHIPRGKRQALNLHEISLMVSLVDFGAHSRYHPVLTKCSDSECREEIFLSKEEVERYTGRGCKHFSYPNGDFSEREKDLIKQAGYRSARTTVAGWNVPGVDPFELKVLEVADNASLNWMIFQISGIAWYLKNRIFRFMGIS
jgi:peptidoglycan/xylan/chitin deacetylase (PgdA/CDA1 family)